MILHDLVRFTGRDMTALINRRTKGAGLKAECSEEEQNNKTEMKHGRPKTMLGWYYSQDRI